MTSPSPEPSSERTETGPALLISHADGTTEEIPLNPPELRDGVLRYDLAEPVTARGGDRVWFLRLPASDLMAPTVMRSTVTLTHVADHSPVVGRYDLPGTLPPHLRLGVTGVAERIDPGAEAARRDDLARDVALLWVAARNEGGWRSMGIRDGWIDPNLTPALDRLAQAYNTTEEQQ